MNIVRVGFVVAAWNDSCLEILLCMRMNPNDQKEYARYLYAICYSNADVREFCQMTMSLYVVNTKSQ